AEGSHRSGVVAVDRAAVADRGRLQAVGHRGGAAGEAERAPGLCTRAERGRTDFAGLRVLVEHRLAGDWILVVEPAANGGARVTVGYRSVAGRVGVDAEGHRATAERRRPEAIGGGVGAEGAAVVGGVGPGTRGDGLVAVHPGLVLARCLD